MAISLGTAGWSIPRLNASLFPPNGSSLERYAAQFPVVEINSSFHRDHRLSTWARWRDSTPAGFRFSVKMPKTITHQAKLIDCSTLLDQFFEQACVLGDKLSVLLVQLPPKLEFDAARTRTFFEEIKARSSIALACEPRNASWFTGKVDTFLANLNVARVAADPAICEAAARPGGWRDLTYWRLHGSPVLYRSSYAGRIEELADRILHFAKDASDSWCIFDNTASSAAILDAFAVEGAVRKRLL